MHHLLIIDDDPDICLLLQKFFTKKGFTASTAPDGESAVAALKKNKIDVALCDFRLPDYTGIEILQKIRIISPDTRVIIITGYSDVNIAVDALKKGASDYVTKPLYPDEILLTVNEALARDVQGKQEKKGSTASSKNTPAVSKEAFVQGHSQQSQVVARHIALIAPTDMSVIILGETGTGKEYVARAIHQQSARQGGPFVAVDCGALPKDLAGSELFGHVKGAFTGAMQDKEGCFQLANGGTLFLDEIGNLSYENQIKMLRVIQERIVKKVGGNKNEPVDVRLLVATNENLQMAVRQGEFREDLFHRLNEFRIELSPLRERPDDITLFARHFLALANEQLDKQVEDFDEASMQHLRMHYWHGNLRELNNVVKRAVLLCQQDQIDTSCLPPEIIGAGAEPGAGQVEVSFHGAMPRSLKAVAEQAEREAIITVLRNTNNNKSRTAEILQVDRKTLYNKLKTYNIQL